MRDMIATKKGMDLRLYNVWLMDNAANQKCGVLGTGIYVSPLCPLLLKTQSHPIIIISSCHIQMGIFPFKNDASSLEKHIKCT